MKKLLGSRQVAGILAGVCAGVDAVNGVVPIWFKWTSK